MKSSLTSGLALSTAMRNGQYFYGYNNFAVSYAWSERFSTTTSYTADAISVTTQ